MGTPRKQAKTACNKSKVKNDQTYGSAILSDDHDFIAPDEICSNAIGLLYWITKKYINNRSFSSLYYEGGSIGFIHVLVNQLGSLVPNINSVQKCLVINRLIAEHTQNPSQFVARIDCLYDELQKRMLCVVPYLWTEEQQYQQVLDWQESQARRRLFYISHDESGQLQTLLTLQRAATNFCIALIEQSKNISGFWQNEGRTRLINLIYHSFIIVAQPTGPYCKTATQYKKLKNIHSAPLNTRIICLLDSHLIDKYIQLDAVDVKLYPFDRQVDETGDSQPSLQWQTQTIISSEGESLSFLYIQLDSIILNKLDEQGKYPLYNSILCQLEFHTKLKIIEPSLEIEFAIKSQPFGICSHGYFFTEFTAEILLIYMGIDPLARMTVENQHTTLVNMVRLHYTLITGVEPTEFTNDFFKKTFKEAYEKNKNIVPLTVFSIYQETLAKLITQIKCLADYPFLSLMYYDGLFFGMCDNISDEELRGDEYRPHLYLRFNSLNKQKSKEDAVVRYIVHNGSLSRATFDMKIFPYDICRLIFESVSPRAACTAIYPAILNCTFKYFQLYFYDELYRISGIPPPDPSQYNPLIPILWEMIGDRYHHKSTNSTNQSYGSSGSHSYGSSNGQSNAASTNEPFIVTTQIDSVNPGHVTVSIQYMNQTVMCNDELIQRISKELVELCSMNASRNNELSNSQNVPIAQSTISS